MQQLVTGILFKNGANKLFFQLSDFHLRLLNGAYQPFVIEKHGDDICLAHWTNVGGDAVRDPEVVLSLAAVENVLAPLYTGWVPKSTEVGRSGYPFPTLAYQNGKVSGFYKKRMAEAYSFCAMWARNLREQGFARLYTPGVDMLSSTPEVKATWAAANIVVPELEVA